MYANPFDVTKADDFSDADIAKLWVDLPSGAGIADILDPTSPMPLLLVGGKGSGKTHLLRHASYPLQKLRGLRNLTGTTSEGYVGVYFRCGGLNAERFKDKGQTPERWQAIFEYYMELWIGQMVLETVVDILSHSPVSSVLEAELSKAVGADIDADADMSSLGALLSYLRIEQRQVNRAVNNCAATHSLDVAVRITRSNLVFGIPRLVTSMIPAMKETRFLYLIDQFEDLAEPHQRYIQTLFRERQYPTSFRVGVRRYGVRTYGTYSAGEINRLGSEYDEVDLDARLRRSSRYPDFARNLALTRLRATGADIKNTSGAEREFLLRLFPAPVSDTLAFEETAFVRETYNGRERPYFERLHQQLLRYLALRPSDAAEIIDELRCEDYPLIEKTNILLLYRAWNHGTANLFGLARQLNRATAHLINDRRDTEQSRVLKHWKADLLAQLYRDCRKPVRYTGFENFVAMSSGYPRNLLVILKNAVRYASFEGSAILSDPISRKAQDAATRDSADWFFRDAGIATPEAELIKTCVTQLATLMRSVRYADLPVECSASSFAVDRALVTAATRDTLDKCVTWSLLVEIPRGHKDKNTADIYQKYQLNPMIAPKWELPLSRRGSLELSAELANSIFDWEYAGTFEGLLQRRMAGMSVPFGKVTRKRDEQIELDGLR